MKIFKSSIIILIALAFITKAQAQELNCRVSVSSQQSNSNSEPIYKVLQKTIFDFMNSTTWTTYKYEVEERIECNITLMITSWDNNDYFVGKMSVQSSRPIYNTSYKTVIFNYQDGDIAFKFQQSQLMDYQENNFTNNLVSILSYYANIVIGLDFDSYMLNGGDPYFTIANSIVNTASSSSQYTNGWVAGSTEQNRYWLVGNLLNSSYSDLRATSYNYHRLGFDVLVEDINKGRQNVLRGINALVMVKRKEPSLFALQLFIDAKRNELIELFSGATAMEKNQVFGYLTEIDPTHISDYNKIKQSKE